MVSKIGGNKNRALVCKYINAGGTWLELHNQLLRLGHKDPQILVDYILSVLGDPFYQQEA